MFLWYGTFLMYFQMNFLQIKEKDFAIDQILGTKPISLPPYKMALVKLKKLKT